MAVPKMTRQNVLDALKYIDENGVPFHNQSTQYDLVSENGKISSQIRYCSYRSYCEWNTDLS
jgi:hypothetical protein